MAAAQNDVRARSDRRERPMVDMDVPFYLEWGLHTVPILRISALFVDALPYE
jgi:hypothetical protein